MRRKFRRIDKFVDRFGYWVGGYGILTSLTTWLGSQLAWLSPYGWPEFILFGILLSLVIVAVTSAALTAWRFFRPVKIDQAQMAPELAIDEGSASTEQKALQEHVAAVTASLFDMTRLLSDRLDRHDKDLAHTGKRIAHVENELAPRTLGLLGLRGEDGSSRIDRLDLSISDLANSLEQLSARIDGDLARIDDSLDKYQARAILQLRSMQRFEDAERLEQEIRRGAVELERIKQGPTTEQDYAEWGREFRQWLENLMRLETIAKQGEVAHGPLTRTTPEEYKGEWSVTVADFVSADAQHDYKQFRLIKRNFENNSPAIMSALWQASRA